jgi:nicotinate-nucleotide adenylyltransferase
MEFFRRAPGQPSRLGILAGTFNPPTVAHLAMAHAALQAVDEVLLVLPRVFPHKAYSGASFEERIELLQLACASEPRITIASTAQGLFIDIARECRGQYGDHVRLSFLCGRDAAERIVGWDYGPGATIAGMLQVFDLLVSAREGEYQIPPEHDTVIEALRLDGRFDDVSATAVRNRINAGDPWEHLVPAQIVDAVRKIYHPERLHLR